MAAAPREARAPSETLTTYRAKRNFDVTPEPRGTRAPPGGHLYTIQKHAARRLHYDLRLELDGVLKSWAITRGPSLNPAEKRLAVRTEDHPIEYAKFEGRIPEGYGAGTVLLWDQGTWEPVGDPHAGLADGKLVFDLNGERLKGRWALIRFHGRGNDKRENWLLIKEKDDDAVSRDGEITESAKTSVASGRPLEAIAKARGGVWKSKQKKDTALEDLHLTHPEKLLFPGAGITKRAFAEYLDLVADRMLVHLANRPLSMLRCPGGQGHCFFQRHVGSGLPDAIRRLDIPNNSGRHEEPFLMISDKPGLLAAAQIDVLEFHIWGVHADDVERPDRIVFDLDPDPAVQFGKVCEAAAQLRDALTELGLRSFPLLSGGKGVHVIVPITRRHGWETVKQFAGAIAHRFADAAPEQFVANMRKAKRTGRIFIDFFRNDRTASAITPYSARAREGAPVAWPVTWEQLPETTSASAVTIATASDRIKEPDPWPDYMKTRQGLTAAILRNLGISPD
jgi:bifunctional non-homologous end joining protein LigD